MNEATRAYLYRIVLAAIPILTALGYLTDELAPMIVALAAAVLSSGLAVKNTTTKG